MRSSTTICGLRFSPAIALILTVSAFASQAGASIQTVNFTSAAQGGGNKGVSWTPLTTDSTLADLVVTARWGLNDTDLTGAGTIDTSRNVYSDPGLVFQDTNGLGVWANGHQMNKKGKIEEAEHGSNEISGGGPHGKEELIFTFDTPAVLDSIVLGFVGLSTMGKNPTEWKQDPMLFITGSAGSEIAISEATLYAIFNNTVLGGFINFFDLAAFSDPAETVSYFRTRNLQDHYEIGHLTYKLPDSPDPPGGSVPGVPEPTSAFVWVGLGILIIAAKGCLRIVD